MTNRVRGHYPEAELAYTAATVANNCYYWIPTHTVLGRSAGLTEAQLAHLGDDPLPVGVYSDAEAAIVRYARRSTLDIRIDDETYATLERHFSRQQIMDFCFTVGLSNLVNRFHATFETDVDAETIAAAEAGDAAAGGCPLPRPSLPRASLMGSIGVNILPPW